MAGNNRQPSTLDPSSRLRDFATYRNHIEPAFGAVPIASINHLAVRQWVAKLSTSGLAPATVHKAYQVLSKILRSAVDADLLVGSPCDRVPLPRIERNEMRFLDPDGVARLANAIDPRYRALVLLGAYGGLRSGELFALRRERLNLVEGRVDVAETAVEVAGHFHFGPPKTRAGRRSVPLPRFVVDELAAHVADIASSDLVFHAPEGGPIRASLFRRRTWEPAVDKAGLAPLRPHDLRHTAVALWIAAGASAHEVARRACHTSSSVVLDRYGHLLPHAEERVTKALDNRGRAGAATARDAIVLEFPREERAKNGPERDASRPPHPAVPALTWGFASGASKNRTCDLILIRDAL
jgi:integrase